MIALIVFWLAYFLIGSSTFIFIEALDRAENKSDNLWPNFWLAGVFWPIGVGAIMLLLSLDKLSKISVKRKDSIKPSIFEKLSPIGALERRIRLKKEE